MSALTATASIAPSELHQAPTPGTPAWHRQRRANTNAVHAADEAHLRAALATAGWRRRGLLQILVRD